MPFIAIEGLDGSGKSTQLKLLQERWNELFPQHEAEFTKEPGGGSTFSHEIRQLALTHPEAGSASPGAIFGLMLASRLEHMDKLVVPSLLAGKVVITDRFEATTYSHQIAGQEGTHLMPVYHAHREVVQSMLPDPHKLHVLILDMEPERAVGRLTARHNESNHFDRRDALFHERVRSGLHEYCEKVDPTAVLIDADLAIEELHARLAQTIGAILKEYETAQ